ncbi:hypothetical protein COV56_00545 [Candidatus Kuenenbacteria bacterium CG11_big_fil_rev_8_21_14_0_20_37_9]|uniref:ABC transporter ATP-binding protein n=2 Tax=Candidatus Kueneniibacteriota TaxID=1752740 RepID=A0A2M6XT04_9BACT|nr:MAG: hypothetical protein AUJ29_00520 [Candidatus Kuenenbacteria bacterium CG1_02_38_13]PIR05874.1 MAG: hypothetical protein COV56_00545 [Candidatus Kuenenbacteria bacterium CG11_big_fil_rev_8_21_14_0_20_37_9]PIU10773.1 MAG: hypothetical protein COT27_01370 [Candidatus Kuenenbacteria bacterium CG08_land_8_20_14_0_20_37_23]
MAHFFIKASAIRSILPQTASKGESPIYMKNQPIQINKEFWCKLWSILKPFQKQVVWLSLAIGFLEITNLINPYLFKLIIDRIAAFNPQKINELLGLIALVFIADSLVSIIHYLKDKKIFTFLMNIEYHLPMLLQKKLISLSLGYHEKENTGNKIIKVQRGVDKLVDLIVNLCWEFWPTVTQIIFTFALMFYFNSKISFIFAIFVPLFILATLKMNKTTNPMRHQRHEKYEEASGMLGQSIINIYTVQSFVQELKETRKYRRNRNDIRKIEKREWAIVLNYNLLRSFIIDFGRACVIFYSAYLAWHANISLGSLVLFISLSETSYHALFRISRTYDRLIESSTGVQRITNVLAEESAIKNNPQIKLKEKLAGKIEFKNVNFSYHQRSAGKALKNINLDINPGETVALVGPSGGGKSTIIKLLYRHYDATSGQILVDNTDIRDYDLYQYRSNLAIVPQEVEVFNTSIRDNIAYGKSKTNLDEIKAAARAANIDFVDKMENGFHTLVGERGIKLSGGQKQRVGIARAILSDPSILIFDEATSNLDTHSEKQIQHALESISKNQTMIIIAHRLSTVINADKIFVINQGRVVESGTHAELMQNKDGIYSHLLELQALGELK